MWIIVLTAFPFVVILFTLVNVWRNLQPTPTPTMVFVPIETAFPQPTVMLGPEETNPAQIEQHWEIVWSADYIANDGSGVDHISDVIDWPGANNPPLTEPCPETLRTQLGVPVGTLIPGSCTWKFRPAIP